MAMPPDLQDEVLAEVLYRQAFLADDFGLTAKRSPPLEACRRTLAERAAERATQRVTMTAARPFPPEDGRAMRAFYRHAAAWMRSEARAFIQQVNTSPRHKTVVCVAAWLTGKIQRQALALKDKGWHCYLVIQSHDQRTEEILKGGFHGVFDGVFMVPRTLFTTFALIRCLRPAAFHVHCATWSQALARAVNEAKRHAACICEVEDIFSVYAEPEVMFDVWSPPRVALEWAMERYLCTRTDGFVHQFAPSTVDELTRRHGPMSPVAVLPNYPDARFTHFADDRPSRHDGVRRLVWAGNVWRDDEHSPADLIPSAGLPAALESFLAQGFACEIHVDPAKTFAPNDRVWAPYLALKRYPRFLFTMGVPAAQLSGHINHCDFGLLLMRLDLERLRVRREKLRLQLANKLFAYFEAGLPVLVNAEFDYMADLVTRYGTGLAVATGDIDRLATLLADFDHERAVDNIRRFNRDHAMADRIDHLIALYRRETPPGSGAGGRQEDCVCCATPRM